MNFRFAYPYPISQLATVGRTITVVIPSAARNLGFGLIPPILGLLVIFAATGSLAQNNNSSSGGHSSASTAPAFSASAPASHAQAGSGATVSPNAQHFPTGPGHAPGQPHQNPQPNPQPRNSGGGYNGAGGYVYPYIYAVPVPYAVDASNAEADNDISQDPDAADNDANYQGGPTVFDRRGSGAASYIPPVDSEAAGNPASAQQSAPADASADAETIDPTILVFKDGHQIEVENYAVVSQTLYDLTPGHRRKIALAELDLPATEKLNDDRGVTFELPSTIQAN